MKERANCLRTLKTEQGRENFLIMRTGIEREPKQHVCSFIPDQNRPTYWVAVNGLRQFILKFKHWIDQFSARTRTKYSEPGLT